MATLSCGVCGGALAPTDLMCPSCTAGVSPRRAPAPAPTVEAAADEPDERPGPQRRCPGSDCGMPVDEAAAACPYCLRELATAAAPPVTTTSLLPAALAARFPYVEPLPASGAEADLFIVEDADGERFMLKLYRLGVELDEQVLETLSGADVAHVVHIVEHGRIDDRGYELLEYLEAGDLARFQQRHGPKLDSSLVRLVLGELADAVEHLHGLGLKHGDLTPSNVLVRHEEPELDLVLTDFGLAAITDATIAFGGDHRRSRRYSSPEQISGAHGRPPDVWALGVITMQLLLGHHPLDDIADETIDYHLLYQPWPVPYDAVRDRTWHPLLRGMLHRQPEHRWTIGDVQRWLAGRRVNDVPDPAAPGPRAPVFRFRGQDLTTPTALARALASSWEPATARLHHVRRWAAQRGDDPALVAWLDELASSPYDRHGRLLRTVLRLDPELVPVYRGVDVGPEGLRALAAAAVSGGPGSHEAELFSSLLAQDVIAAVAELTGSTGHRTIAAEIDAARPQLEQLLRTAASEGLDLDEDVHERARLRLVQLVVDPDERRRVAREVRRRDHEDLPGWYRELLAPDAGPAALVVASALLTAVLEELAAGRDARRRQRLEERASASDAEGHLARLSRVGAALLVGGLAAFLPLVVVVGLAVAAAADRYLAAIGRWWRRESAIALTTSRVLALPVLAVRWLLTAALRVAGEVLMLAVIGGVVVGLATALAGVVDGTMPESVAVGDAVQARLLPAIVAAASFLLLRPAPHDPGFPRLRALAVRLRTAPVGVLLVVTGAGIAAAVAAWELGPAQPHAPIVALADPAADRVAAWAERTFDPAPDPRSSAPPPAAPPPPDPDPAPEPQRWQVTGASQLNVRAEPGLDSTVLTSLGEGQVLAATGRTREVDDILWVELELDDATTGWASSRYLDAVP